LIGGVVLVVALVGRSAPREQSIAVALGSLKVSRLEGVVTRAGDSEPTAGFSQDFPGTSPRTVRHAFSAPDGTYIVVITLRYRPEESANGGIAPTKPETSFERRVSLGDGEVTVSPD
jgi:hypothetical protein